MIVSYTIVSFERWFNDKQFLINRMYFEVYLLPATQLLVNMLFVLVPKASSS